MAEDKQSDLGAIQVHKKVLAEIIHNAVSEIDGVHLTPLDPIGKVLALSPSRGGRDIMPQA